MDPSASSGPSHARLPTYEEIRAEQELKESFAQLSRDHDEIQKLFKSVASQLETTPKIGEEHELCQEWDALFKVGTSAGCDVTLNNFNHIMRP
jgi:hypothetical protein